MCDRCKKAIDFNGALRTQTALSFTIKGWDGELENFFKRDKVIDLCYDCFDLFMFFTKSPKIGDTMRCGDLVATFREIEK